MTGLLAILVPELIEVAVMSGRWINTRQSHAWKREPYRKNNDNILLALNYDSEIKSDLKTLEGFMNEDVLDRCRGDESCCRG